MEDNEAVLPSKKSKKPLYIVLGVIALILFLSLSWFFIFSYLSITKESQQFNLNYGGDSAIVSPSPLMLSKERNLNFLQLQLTEAKKDSIIVVFDIPSQTIMLKLQGVTIHQASVLAYEISPFILKQNYAHINRWEETPFKIRFTTSTIEKEPIVVKKAPKDTAEANQNYTAPQLPPDEFVEYVWNLNKNLNIHFIQDSINTQEHIKEMKNFKRYFRNKKLKELYQHSIHMKIPTYTPVVKVYLNQNDAKTIYRATPPHATVILKF